MMSAFRVTALRSSWTAIWLATSPAACPPIPSATTNRLTFLSTRKLSSLWSRCLHASVAAQNLVSSGVGVTIITPPPGVLSRREGRSAVGAEGHAGDGRIGSGHREILGRENAHDVILPRLAKGQRLRGLVEVVTAEADPRAGRKLHGRVVARGDRIRTRVGLVKHGRARGRDEVGGPMVHVAGRAQKVDVLGQRAARRGGVHAGRNRDGDVVHEDGAGMAADGPRRRHVQDHSYVAGEILPGRVDV